MARHPGPEFEDNKEQAARSHCAAVLKDLKKLAEEIPAVSDEELKARHKPPALLEKICEESALHLGKVYACEIRMGKQTTDAKEVERLTAIRDVSRARHEFLMGEAGRLMAFITQAGPRQI
jgi:hypothetical protein